MDVTQYSYRVCDFMNYFFDKLGVQNLSERRQAPRVPSTVPNVLAPEVMRAVATTFCTAASPLAGHMPQ